MAADGAVTRVHLPVVAEGYAPPQRVRAQTENTARLAKRTLLRDAALYPERPGVDYLRPQTFAECESVGLGDWQPCPFVSCKHHLALDVNPRTGSIKRNLPHLDIDELPATCALRVATEGGRTLDGVAALMGMTRERVRQVETMALQRVRGSIDSATWTALDDALDHFDETRGER